MSMACGGKTRSRTARKRCRVVTPPSHLPMDGRQARDATIHHRGPRHQFLRAPVSNKSGTDYQSAAKFWRIAPTYGMAGVRLPPFPSTQAVKGGQMSDDRGTNTRDISCALR